MGYTGTTETTGSGGGTDFGEIITLLIESPFVTEFSFSAVGVEISVEGGSGALKESRWFIATGSPISVRNYRN